MNIYTNKNKLWLAALLLFCAPTCFAERADRDKPVHLEADQVMMDDAQHISTFTGSVQFTQGTMIIRGDKIVVVEDNEGYKHGTAYGRLASYRQKREGLNEYVSGFGERIEYDTRAETVDFYGQAHVVRDLDDVRGDHVTYNQKTDIFQVHSSGTTNAKALPNRVRAVLQPKRKNEAAKPLLPADTLPIKPSSTLLPER